MRGDLVSTISDEAYTFDGLKVSHLHMGYLADDEYTFTSQAEKDAFINALLNRGTWAQV